MLVRDGIVPRLSTGHPGHSPVGPSSLEMPRAANSTEPLKISLRDQALDIALANVELAVFGQVDSPTQEGY